MFKCDKCDKIFTANHLLKRHIKFVHDKCNIEYVNCNKCDKKFSTKFTLLHHVKHIHDKIKDFKCDKCEYKCSSNCDIIKHKKQVHEKIKDFKCNKCEYVCSDNIKLKSHIKRIHDKIKDFKCNKCEYKCVSGGDLKKHINGVHERPIMDKKMSLGEYAIYNYLTKNNIEFVKEHTFNDLKSPKNSLLRYDFYIKSYNLLIEFDGRQHFEKNKWKSYHTEQIVNDMFDYLVECDHLKNEYADANKIKLYRIKYTEIKNIDNILKVLLI